MISKLLLAAVLLTLTAMPVHAQQPERETQIHVVQPGETLYRIARNNGLTVEELQRLNGIQGTTIRVGQRLVVGYSTPDVEEAAGEEETRDAEDALALPPSEPARGPDEGPAYTARPGDTFYSIALRYGITSDTLLALNDGQTAPLEPGQEVRLPASFGPTTHTVQTGETLSGVAQHYGLDAELLLSVNRLRDDASAGDTLRAGQTLRIPARRNPVVSRADILPPPDDAGVVTRYPETFTGRLTASGEPYDPEQFTVSHRELPFGTVLLLTSPATERHTFAVVNDRGPVDASYLLDVSDAVLDALGVTDERGPKVQMHVIR